jgi:asparagine synthase (glutamine-hydrolysing)
MCGIIGIAARSAPAQRHWLGAGCDALHHRGPDGGGEWWSEDGRVGLGHRRLAIIDLSAAGHQPMPDVSGTLHIVFNGEIYNFTDLRDALVAKGHVFRSRTDTEVILAAYREWGVDCVTRMNGMFAFALYDAPRRSVFMARDRAGEKPLFYALADGALRFASELKGLMSDPAFPRRIDREALDCYLAMGFIPGERCILEGVRKLPPAHALLFHAETGDMKVWRYWDLPAPAESGVNRPALESELVAELEVLLDDAVRRQLVADVPVGVLLSGGVDSSVITAMAVRNAPAVKTFTVCFPGHGAFDETEHARLIAQHFGTEHLELQAGQTTPELMPMLARQFDEPIVDSSMIPTYLVSRLVREHCTVALGGDGGDELFAGYGHYDRLLWMKGRLGRVPREVRVPIARAAEAILPIGFKGRNWLQGLGEDLDSGLPLIGSYFDRAARRRLLDNGRGSAPVAEEIRRERIPAMADMLERATRMDFENYLAEDILVKVDRASMLNSLEVRAPLLDYRVIEFAFGRVPSELKATTAGRKLLLKKLAARLLPSDFDARRKQGFSIPLAAWLREPVWHAFFRDVLLGPDAFFSAKVVGELLEGHLKGRSNSERLFALVMFELWRREYSIAA